MSQTYEQLVSGTTPLSQLYGKTNNMTEALRSAFSGTAFPSSPTPVAGQPCYRTDRLDSRGYPKQYVYTNNPALGETGWIENSEGGVLGGEVINARGTKSTLDQRLDVALNEDGTLKAATTLNPSQWYKPSLTFTYVSTTSFTVNGDQTDIYKSTRRLKINLSASVVYSEVVSATYSSPNTTVTITNTVLNNTLVDVEHSLFLPHKDSGAITKRMTDKVVALTDGATINTDASAGNIFKVTLAGNRTLAAPTNPSAGQQCIWVFTQDGTGNKTITLHSSFRNLTGLSSITLSTAANAVDYMIVVYNSEEAKWDVIGFVPLNISVSDSIINKTSTYTLLPADLTGRKKFTNYQTTGQVNFIAPVAVASYKTGLRVVEAYNVNFVPEVTDSVFMGGTTLSPYTTGTISVSDGLPTVTGVGTTWTTNAKAGDSFRGNGGGLYIIQSVDSNTQITLTANHSGALSGVTYGIGKSVACKVVGFEFIIESYAANKWTIRGAGVQPIMLANKADNQTITAGNTTKVTFDEVIDNNANYASNRWTPTILGFYNLKTIITAYAVEGAVSKGRIHIYKNNSDLYNPATSFLNGATTVPETVLNSYPIQVVNTTDYYEIFYYAEGYNKVINSLTYISNFSAERISD